MCWEKGACGTFSGLLLVAAVDEQVAWTVREEGQEDGGDEARERREAQQDRPPLCSSCRENTKSELCSATWFSSDSWMTAEKGFLTEHPLSAIIFPAKKLLPLGILGKKFWRQNRDLDAGWFHCHLFRLLWLSSWWFLMLWIYKPNNCFNPMICDTRMPNVSPNWCSTPMAPLMLTGAISVRYIGTKPVPAPVMWQRYLSSMQ